MNLNTLTNSFLKKIENHNFSKNIFLPKGNPYNSSIGYKDMDLWFNHGFVQKLIEKIKDECTFDLSYHHLGHTFPKHLFVYLSDNNFRGVVWETDYHKELLITDSKDKVLFFWSNDKHEWDKMNVSNSFDQWYSDFIYSRTAYQPDDNTISFEPERIKNYIDGIVFPFPSLGFWKIETRFKSKYKMIPVTIIKDMYMGGDFVKYATMIDRTMIFEFRVMDIPSTHLDHKLSNNDSLMALKMISFVYDEIFKLKQNTIIKTIVIE